MEEITTDRFSGCCDVYGWRWVATSCARSRKPIPQPSLAAKTSMQTRHAQMQSFYTSGAVGLTQDGYVAVKDASAVPLSQRGGLAGLVKDENTDRARLYKEIAAANSGHPEMAWGEIQKYLLLDAGLIRRKVVGFIKKTVHG